MAFDLPFYHQNTHVNITILVVDDDPIFLSIIPDMLKNPSYKDKSCGEITVMTANDSSEAVSTLRGQCNNIDVVIADYHMPGLNGVQLKRRIAEEFGNLPVIVISADMNSEIEQETLSSGATCFLKKPIKPNDLNVIWEQALNYKMNDCSKKIEKTNSDSTSNPDDGDSPPHDKINIKWTRDLEDLFYRAIHHIGVHKATPKRILEYMNVKYLTRHHIASKLQKYRNFLKRVKEEGVETARKAMNPNFTSSSYIINPQHSYNYNISQSNNNLFINSQPGYGIGQSSPMMNNNAGLHDYVNYINRRPTYDLSQIGSNLLPRRGSLGFPNGMLPLKEERISIFGTSQESQSPRFGQYGTTRDVLGMNSNLSTMGSNYAGIRINENGDGNDSLDGIRVHGNGNVNSNDSLGGIKAHVTGNTNGNGSLDGIRIHGNDNGNGNGNGSLGGIRVHGTGNGNDFFGGIRDHGIGNGNGNDYNSSLDGIRVHGNGNGNGNGNGSLGGIRVHGTDNGNGNGSFGGIRDHDTGNGNGYDNSSLDGIRVHGTGNGNGNGSFGGIRVGNGNGSLDGIRVHGNGNDNGNGSLGGIRVHGTDNGNGSFGGIRDHGTGNGNGYGNGYDNSSLDGIRVHGTGNGNGNGSLGGIRVGNTNGNGSLDGIRVHGNGNGNGNGSLGGIRVHGTDNGNGNDSFGGIRDHGTENGNGYGNGYDNSSLDGIRVHGTGNGNSNGYLGGIRVYGTGSGNSNGSLGENLGGLNWNFNNNNMSNHGSSTSRVPAALSSFLDIEDKSQNNLIVQTDGMVPVLENPSILIDHHGIEVNSHDKNQHQDKVAGENLGESTACPLEDVSNWSFNNGNNNEETFNPIAAYTEMYFPTGDMNIINQEHGVADLAEFSFDQDFDEDFMNDLLEPDMN